MSGWSVTAWVLVATGRPVSGAAVGFGSAAALIPKLPDVPAREAFRFAAVGNARAGWLIAHTVRRAWWPILALLAIRSTTARRVLVVSLLAVRDPRELADDLAYSVGVWKGMLAARTVDPIVPEIISWPGRKRASRPEPGSARDAFTDRFRWYRRLL